jgi:hypothetical protein
MTGAVAPVVMATIYAVPAVATKTNACTPLLSAEPSIQRNPLELAKRNYSLEVKAVEEVKTASALVIAPFYAPTSEYSLVLFKAVFVKKEADPTLFPADIL